MESVAWMWGLVLARPAVIVATKVGRTAATAATAAVGTEPVVAALP